MFLFLRLFIDLYIIPTTAILNGHNISIDKVPYQINYGDICGGVLVHKKWALTTAHCGTEQNYIRIGNTRRLRGPKVKLISHMVHPKFGIYHKFDYDIQLLEMYRGLHFGKLVSSIPISDGECGDIIDVSGWGYGKEKGDYNEILQQVRLPVVSLQTCQQVQQFWYNYTLTERMFCAGGGDTDACQGDSGGGAVYFGHLIGLSSFGFGCGRPNIPGVYVNVTHVDIRKWIRRHTGV